MGEKEAQVLLEIKAAIAGLPHDQYQAVNDAAAEIRAIVRRNDFFGPLALALVGAEMAAERD